MTMEPLSTVCIVPERMDDDEERKVGPEALGFRSHMHGW